MKKIYIISIIIISIFIISVVITLNFTKSENENNKQEEIKNTQISEIIEDECTEEYIQEKELTPVVSEPEKISINAQLILKKYFSQCDHTINEYTEMPEECINMTKEELQEQYPDWEVIGFEPNKVTLYKEFDDTCGEHFKLKIEDGKINIYLINKDGTESLYEKTNISSEYLTETDLININEEGLEIYGKEELNKTIEDFE
mgnify:FL=1